MGVDTKAAGVQFARQRFGRCQLGGRQRNRGWPPLGDFLRKTRSAQRTTRRTGKGVGDDGVRQQAAAGLETLADPDETPGEATLTKCRSGFPEAGNRCRDDGDVGTREGGGKVTGRDQRIGKAITGQEGGVLAGRQHRRNVVLLARPEPDRPVGRPGDRQGRTPGAGAEDGDGHATAHAELG